MYNILIVDDELPALRFLETIISKYAPDFTIISQQRDGASALSWLKAHSSDVDILITDIRMPDMDGITLSKAARNLREDLHIVIVSGYSEFEYAHGAIEASVDDYILKPISVSHMRELLDKIKNQLDTIKADQTFLELTALIKNENKGVRHLKSLFGDSMYYFALIRFGNVLYPIHNLHGTSVAGILPFSEILSWEENPERANLQSVLFNNEKPHSLITIEPENIYFLTGRDDKEFLLISKAGGSVSTFQKAVRQIARDSGYSMVTAIMVQSGVSFYRLGFFYANASKLLRYTAIIGNYHEEIIAVPEESCPSEASSDDFEHAFKKLAAMINNYDAEAAVSGHVPPIILKRLGICVSDNNQKEIRSILRALGNEWDEKKVTQRQSYVMMQQLLHLVETIRLNHWKSTDQIMHEADALTNTASSYLDLLENLYGVLYNPEITDLKQYSPEDMFQYAIRTIQKKFNQPISIQTVCSEIGISQTYLSRLFRKYGETSFNSYLVQCRMDNARGILKEHPDMPLHQVAACVGYDDYAYFSKVFRQVTGLSPSQFQASLKQQNL